MAETKLATNNDSSLNESNSGSGIPFVLPLVNDNSDGWGPNNQPEKYKDLPYQKFSKSDRIGKIADWASHQDKKNFKYQPQFSVGNVGQYSYFHDEDESQFTLVDQSRVNKNPYQKTKTRNSQNKKQQNKLFNLSKLQTGNKLNKQFKQEKTKPSKNIKGRDQRAQTKQREPSVQVKDDWKLIEEIEFSRLTKLSLPISEDPIDLKLCGSLEYYDRSYDRINTKSTSANNRLKRVNRVLHKVATLDDPIIRQLSKTEEASVFTTDSIISTLMCCSRSVYPWDIIVVKFGNKIFLDKRDDNTNFDMLTVSETSGDPPQDEEKSINSPASLALEATYINHNFSQQVLRMNEERHSFPEPNPFLVEGDETEVASIAYKYRKWDLGEGVNIIIRSEVDAVTSGPNDEKIFLSIKALNEWTATGMDWRAKLDGQPGAVLATEIKNNGCKLAKWTVCSLLAGVDQMKFGFVSRQNMRATDKHVILGTQQFKPNEFAYQIALNMDNSWGIVRCIIDFIKKRPDGKYVLMKDPMKPILRIYEIPENTFSDDQEENEDDEN